MQCHPAESCHAETVQLRQLMCKKKIIVYPNNFLIVLTCSPRFVRPSETRGHWRPSETGNVWLVKWRDSQRMVSKRTGTSEGDRLVKSIYYIMRKCKSSRTVHSFHTSNVYSAVVAGETLGCMVSPLLYTNSDSRQPASTKFTSCPSLERGRYRQPRRGHARMVPTSIVPQA